MADETVESLPKTTPDIAQEQIERLRRTFPESVSEGQVDFDLLRATLGDADALAGDNAYTFTWAGSTRPSAMSVLKPTNSSIIRLVIFPN